MFIQFKCKTNNLNLSEQAAVYDNFVSIKKYEQNDTKSKECSLFDF
jgi:hypothetical protein